MEAFINEYVTDISSTGVFIQSKDPLPVGTQVNLKFSLDPRRAARRRGGGRGGARSSARPLGMGVAFRAVGPEAQKIIGRAIKERRAAT